MPSLGNRSRLELSTCDPKLQRVISAAAGVFDLSVIDGFRSPEDQAAALRSGHSTVMHGKHNVTPAQAVDCWPYVMPFGKLSGNADQVAAISRATGKSPERVGAWIRERFVEMAGHVKMAAAMQGIGIRWGGDWNSDGDGNLLDNVTLDDLPHFELV